MIYNWISSPHRRALIINLLCWSAKLGDRNTAYATVHAHACNTILQKTPTWLSKNSVCLVLCYLFKYTSTHPKTVTEKLSFSACVRVCLLVCVCVCWVGVKAAVWPLQALNGVKKKWSLLFYKCMPDLLRFFTSADLNAPLSIWHPLTAALCRKWPLQMHTVLLIA